jgi:hypothetical protein
MEEGNILIFNGPDDPAFSKGMLNTRVLEPVDIGENLYPLQKKYDKYDSLSNIEEDTYMYNYKPHDNIPILKQDVITDGYLLFSDEIKKEYALYIGIELCRMHPFTRAIYQKNKIRFTGITKKYFKNAYKIIWGSLITEFSTDGMSELDTRKYNYLVNILEEMINISREYYNMNQTNNLEQNYISFMWFHFKKFTNVTYNTLGNYIYHICQEIWLVMHLLSIDLKLIYYKNIRPIVRPDKFTSIYAFVDGWAFGIDFEIYINKNRSKSDKKNDFESYLNEIIRADMESNK